MIEDEARRVLLVRAIEEEDEAGDLLTRQDRVQAYEAGRAALGSIGSASGRKGDDLFLSRRAEFATGRLASRTPAIGQVLARTRWPRWIGWAVPLGAFVVGAALNELGSGRRLDLLAFPLLGMLAWNGLVYLWMLVTIVPRSKRSAPAGLAKWLEKAAHIGRRSYDRATPIARALSHFVAQWSAASASLAAARSARTLHLSAATFALGIVAGIYVRALGVEYSAGWESTFLDADTVHAILALVLGPASALTGVPIPDVEGIAAIRWTGAETGGANAAPWIYLTTATVIGFVVLPRLVLAGLAALRAWRKAARFPLPDREAFYYRRLLRGAHGQAGSIRVTPYAYHPDDAAKAALQSAVQDALGDGAALRFDAPVEYGAEDRWLDAAQFDAGDDHHLLLFTLSATPEHENHGVLAQRLRETLAKAHPGTLVGAIIDESPFRRRFAGQSASAARIVTRGEAWDGVLARAGMPALKLDLGEIGVEEAESLEALLTGKLTRRLAA